MKTRELVFWIALGALGVVTLAWAYPRAMPFAPRGWKLSRNQAEAIALERFRDLGEPLERSYVITRLGSEALLEQRLHLAEAAAGEEGLARGRLANRVFFWEVVVYGPGARAREWTYRARLALDGEVLSLRLRLPDEEGTGVADPREARQAADLFLREQGVDLARYEEPESRTQQLRSRTDSVYRYRLKELELGDRFPYGVEVRFAGDRLVGYQSWFDEPEQGMLQTALQPLQFLSVSRNLSVLLLLPLVAVPFLRRYHAGEIGVRRGLQIGAPVLVLGAGLMLISAAAISEDASIGVFSRLQQTWFFVAWMVGFMFLPMSLVAFLSWSVGESFCRASWGGKLAAFDALFQRAWASSTVARSALRGTAAGAALAGGLMLVGLGLDRQGVPQLASFQINSWWFSSHWTGIIVLGFLLIWTLYGELFGRLFLVPAASRRFGKIAGAAVAALVGGILCWGSGVAAFSPFWMLAGGVLAAACLVILFLRYDLLTSLVASLFSGVLTTSYPLLSSDNAWLELQGALAVIGAAAPLIVSIRSATGGREFVYRYEDVPPHVRRIAERERQRVELETARRIQSSILPELPPQLAGVRIAHCYLPATEVGGDFYDVMALEDGRLAVAVGDVAGHGVSSGLVMSMAKSALAVQVTFDPEVEAVFRTLNRMVYQSARKRLLTTLCYALIDPRNRELFYASAGHLFPYRISRGQVHALESVSYPLGVRDSLEVRVRGARLEAGDHLFLFSDGVIEATPEGSDEPFGFERLERSLRRHSGAGASGIRDGVLEDLREFTGAGPREDDLTLLVLELP